MLKPSERRAPFEDLTAGWGLDSLEDLVARQQLLNELFTQLCGFTSAEQKVADAIGARIRTLQAGGT